jgi:outer membrane protein assembly factor BamA
MEHLLHARYAKDRQQYYAQLRANRIFSTYLTARTRLFYGSLDRTIFGPDNTLIGVRNEKKYGGLFRIGQQIARLGTVTGGIKIEEIEYDYGRTDGKERFGLRSLTLESVVETFNRPTFPETGNKHLFQLQFAGKLIGGDAEFTRYFSSFETYLPLLSSLVYHPRLSVGISRTGLPPSEQFYVGGIHSFSGFRTYQLAGDKAFLFNQEMRLKLPLRLYLYARYDIGEVYNSADQIKLRNLRHGVGFSIALDSPIGPFEFGYGVADKENDRYYFQAGFDF